MDMTKTTHCSCDFHVEGCVCFGEENGLGNGQVTPGRPSPVPALLGRLTHRVGRWAVQVQRPLTPRRPEDGACRTARTPAAAAWCSLCVRLHADHVHLSAFPRGSAGSPGHPEVERFSAVTGLTPEGGPGAAQTGLPAAARTHPTGPIP